MAGQEEMQLSAHERSALRQELQRFVNPALQHILQDHTGAATPAESEDCPVLSGHGAEQFRAQIENGCRILGARASETITEYNASDLCSVSSGRELSVHCFVVSSCLPKLHTGIYSSMMCS